MTPRDFRPSRATVDLALAVPLSGPAGIFGPSCEACATLAVEDINAVGGILGRSVRLRTVDAGAPLPALAARIDRMVSLGMIDGVIGWHLFNVRKAITPHTAGRVPYVYTTFYEGGEDSDGVYMVGETPDQQLFPALRWFRAEMGIRRSEFGSPCRSTCGRDCANFVAAESTWSGWASIWSAPRNAGARNSLDEPCPRARVRRVSREMGVRRQFPEICGECDPDTGAPWRVRH